MKKSIFIISSILVILILNVAIFQKESILKHGEIIYLKLAPIDPRSLLQGDYMRLGYEVNQTLSSGSISNSLDKTRGFMVIHLDKASVGQFVRLYKGEALNADDYLMRYKQVNFTKTIMPNSFFFQEGLASFYQNAKYGVFKMAPNHKDYVLVGLANENREMIIVPKTQLLSPTNQTLPK